MIEYRLANQNTELDRVDNVESDVGERAVFTKVDSGDDFAENSSGATYPLYGFRCLVPIEVENIVR